jgi:hypothetical protein
LLRSLALIFVRFVFSEADKTIFVIVFAFVSCPSSEYVC